MSRDWLLYLEDVAQAAEKIGRFTDGIQIDKFHPQSPIFDAVLFNLQIIGEATKNLPDEARTAMPEVAWTKAARFRDLIAHHYFALDHAIVWDVVTRLVPDIAVAARRLLTTLDGDSTNR